MEDNRFVAESRMEIWDPLSSSEKMGYREGVEETSHSGVVSIGRMVSDSPKKGLVSGKSS
jgi:hypothetical protein